MMRLGVVIMSLHKVVSGLYALSKKQADKKIPVARTCLYVVTQSRRPRNVIEHAVIPLSQRSSQY